MKDPGELFFKEEVQNLLLRITGRDHGKIFRFRKLGTRLQAPDYKLLTDEELQQVIAETEEKANKNLKMPPLLKERDTRVKILARNPELQGFDTAKYIFTDITPGLSDVVSFFYRNVFFNAILIYSFMSALQKRTVVTRDPDGVLREASWDEKQRVCEIYFPRHGREMEVPKMFEDENLQVKRIIIGLFSFYFQCFI